MLFHTQRREVAGWSVVRVIGEVDLASAPSMRAALRALPAGASVAVDLSDCSLIDSVGIGLLIGGARRARRRWPDGGGRTTGRSGTPHARHLSRRCGARRCVVVGRVRPARSR
ncbi:MAG: STAS domain-containing protein [Actinobacteria bacterium]|nr:STAS domain-containing protein [Actinomycetota bacterium]